MTLIEKNVQLGKPLHLSPWRKIAIGTWKTAGDPSVYGLLEFDVSPALAYIEKLRSQTGVRITVSHFIAKAIASAFALHPQLNCVLRFGRLYPRKNVDIFFQVATDPLGKDLSGVTIREADKKSISDIAEDMHRQVEIVRKKGDPSFKKTKNLMKNVPGLFLRTIIDLTGFILYGLNLWSPILGTPKDAFGSVMITNIGSLGLNLGFAPLVPYSRVPVLVALGAITEKPVVKNGQIVIAPIIQAGITFDHRVIDGVHGSHIVKVISNFFADPEGFLESNP